MVAIAVENLRKTYGGVVASDDLSFTIDVGEVFSLLGPNGAGRSTRLVGHLGAALPNTFPSLEETAWTRATFGRSWMPAPRTARSRSGWKYANAMAASAPTSSAPANPDAPRSCPTTQHRRQAGAATPDGTFPWTPVDSPSTQRRLERLSSA